MSLPFPLLRLLVRTRRRCRRLARQLAVASSAVVASLWYAIFTLSWLAVGTAAWVASVVLLVLSSIVAALGWHASGE